MSRPGPGDHSTPLEETSTPARAQRRASLTLKEKILDAFLHRQPSRAVRNRPSEVDSPLPGLHMLSPFSSRRLRPQKQSLKLKTSLPASQAEDSDLPQSEAVPDCSRSPLDKPLPRIPTDAIDFDPQLTQASLIDATENPLLTEMSPGEIKDWPSLSPRRQEKKAFEPLKVKPNKVSLSESVIERVRKLNLHDADDLDVVGAPSDGQNVTPRSTSRKTRASQSEDTKRRQDLGTASVTSRQSAIDQSDAEKRALTPNRLLFIAKGSKSTAASKFTTPVVRQTRTSELRKRLASNPLAGSETKKPKADNPVSIASSTPILSLSKKSEAETSTKVAGRSQSKHRVTSTGSPYTIIRSARESITDTEIQPLELSPNLQNDLNLGVASDRANVGADKSAERFYNSQIAGTSAAPQFYRSPGSSLRSSRSVPRYRARKRINSDSEADITPLLLRKSTSSKQELDLGDDGDVDTDSIHRRGRRSRRGSQADRTSTMMEIHEAKVAVRARARVGTDSDNFRIYDDNESIKDTSPGAQSLVGTIYGEDEYEKFKVKPLSRSAPKHGPQLRVSLSAKEFLLGVTTSDSDMGSSLPHTKPTLDRDNTRIDFPAQQLPEKAAIGDISQVRSEHTDKEASRSSYDLDQNYVDDDALLDDHDQSWYAKVKNLAVNTQQGVAAAPPVEPGTPQDKSKKIGWPFNESVVVPFKSLEQISRSEEHHRTEERKGRVDMSEVLLEKTEAAKIPPAAAGSFVPSKGVERFERSPDRVLANVKLTRSTQRSRKELPYDSKGDGGKTPQLYHEPPPVESPVTKTPTSSSLPRTIKSLSRSNRRVAQLTQTEAASPPPASPTLTNGKHSGGKGVIQNIKGLFHKRGLESKIPLRNSPASIGMRNSSAKTMDLRPPGYNPTPLIPRPARVRDTTPTIYERRQARLDQMPVLGHRDGISVAATFSPDTSKVTGRGTSGHTGMRIPKIETATTAAPKMKSGPETNYGTAPEPVEPVELTSATSAVYGILNRAQDESRTERKLEYIELSKLMVQALHTARDAEKSKEQARHFAAKAELECLRARKEIISVAEMVEKMLRYGDNDVRDQRGTI